MGSAFADRSGHVIRRRGRESGGDGGRPSLPPAARWAVFACRRMFWGLAVDAMLLFWEPFNADVEALCFCFLAVGDDRAFSSLVLKIWLRLWAAAITFLLISLAMLPALLCSLSVAIRAVPSEASCWYCSPKRGSGREEAPTRLGEVSE